MEEPELEVGSDEDGELEAYNMDPGKLLKRPHFFAPSIRLDASKCRDPYLLTFGPLFLIAPHFFPPFGLSCSTEILCEVAIICSQQMSQILLSRVEVRWKVDAIFHAFCLRPSAIIVAQSLSFLHV